MQVILQDKNGITFHTENKYCKEDISVAIANNSLEVIPSSEQQVFDGLYTSVTVSGANNTGGTVDVPVKLFGTIEEMQADRTSTEGDLAIVYGQIQRKMQSTDQPTKIYFPETVVFETAIEDMYMEMLTPKDATVYINCQIELETSYFNCMIQTESSDAYITYTSEDGVTYTRDSSSPSEFDFGTPMLFEGWENSSNDVLMGDVFSNFLYVDSMNFEGFYSYDTLDDNESHVFKTNIEVDTSGNVTYDTLQIYTRTLVDAILRHKTELGHTYTGGTIEPTIVYNNGHFDMYYYANPSDGFTLGSQRLHTSDGTTIYLGYSQMSDSYVPKKASFDLENDTVTVTDLTEIITIDEAPCFYQLQIDDYVTKISIAPHDESVFVNGTIAIAYNGSYYSMPVELGTKNMWVQKS